MAVLTGALGPIDLANKLADELAAGRPARASYGSRDASFTWATGLPDTLATHVRSASVEGLSFNSVRVKPSGTPAALTAKGAAKPNPATTITAVPVALSKYAGIGVITTEDTLTTDGLVSAIAAVMANSIVLAYDASCITALTVAGQPTATAATWSAAVLGGIAAVAAAGGRPDTLVLSAADYALAVGSPGVGYAMSPADAIPTLFGLAIVISPTLVAKTAFVIDSNACLAVENSSSPIGIVDPYGSNLGTNSISVAVEAFLGFVVSSPGGVCKVTYTGT